MLAAATDLSLLLAAIPTSIAAVVVGWLTFKGTRHAAPAVAEAAKIEPRLTEVEERQALLRAALDAKDALIAERGERIADLEDEVRHLRIELAAHVGPPARQRPSAD